MKKLISIIAPVYNEESNIKEFYARLLKMSKQMNKYNFEFIFVNDGSRDKSASMLSVLAKKNRQTKLINFSRNFGHQIAVSAGLDHAKGDAIIIMDTDLQDPPEFLPALIRKWEDGFDVVYAVRTKRKEGLIKRFCYHAFYWLLNKISEVEIPRDTGDFSLINKITKENIISCRERSKFIRGIRAWAGAKQVGIEYERDARFSGTPSYTWRALIKLAFSGLVSFSRAPLRLAIYAGFMISLIGFVGVFIVIYLKLVHPDLYVLGIPTILVAILFLGGVQMLMLGIFGEYIGQIYTEVQDRPLYIIKNKINFGKK